MPDLRNASFEEKVLMQLSRIDISIRAVADAINLPNIFPKQEIVNMSDDLKEQFDKNREENRKEKQLELQEKQLRYTLAIAIVSLIISIVGLFIKK